MHLSLGVVSIVLVSFQGLGLKLILEIFLRMKKKSVVHEVNSADSTRPNANITRSTILPLMIATAGSHCCYIYKRVQITMLLIMTNYKYT